MSEHTIIIEPNKKLSHFRKELWDYRELFFFLAWRTFLVRYKQTVIGISWSLIRPILSVVVFSIVFGKIAKLPSENIPYPILVYAAILPWQFFAGTFTTSSGSIVMSQGMITKIYFPRVIIPTSTILSGLVDFFLSFAVFIGMMVWYQFMPTLNILYIFPLLLLTMTISLGLGFWISALNVKYRDFQIIIPFIVQFGLYLSPVGFSSNVIPEAWRFWYSLNPMVGVIDGFRWAILGQDTGLYIPGFIMSIVISIIIFLTGLQFFRKTERGFADYI